MKNKKIGIVIIGRNEGDRLILCLESVLKANIACVYVDSQSIDNSVKEANRRSVKAIVLDQSAPINASRARNTGFKILIKENPEIEYVHFIDADCELHPDWLDHAISTLDKIENIAVVCGRLHEKHKNKNIYTRLCDMDWYIKPGDIEACGGIATIRRSVLEEMKGFDESLIAGADPELYFRIRNEGGYKISCLPVDMGTHDSDMNYFSEYWKRSVKTGYAYVSKMKLGGSKQPVVSALAWGMGLPLIILTLGLWLDYQFLFLVLIYPFQTVRIYRASQNLPFSCYDRFIYSLSCVVGKFSEAQGIVKYIFNLLTNSPQKIIEYKLKK